ncbi:hypothetical protein ACFY4C_28605 [Actinomadura viridis]|uniref:hypothetical protein n=1 Tax=Actinomadura viridis TaxID=58110 RepID=UPI0036C2F7EF
MTTSVHQAPTGHRHAAQAGAHADVHAGAHADAPGGLLISQDGYTLAPETSVLPRGATEFRFRILGPGGEPVSDLAPVHGRRLHLILARRDLTWFRHLHPAEIGDGVWAVRLDLPEAGAYRVFTDLAPPGPSAGP